ISFVGVPEWLDGDAYVAWAPMTGHGFTIAGQSRAAAFVAQRHVFNGRNEDVYGFSANGWLDAYTELLVYPSNPQPVNGAEHDVVWGWNGCWNVAGNVPLRPSTCSQPGSTGCRQDQTVAFLPMTDADVGDACSWQVPGCWFTGEIRDPDLGLVCPADHPYLQRSGIQDRLNGTESLCCNCAPF